MQLDVEEGLILLAHTSETQTVGRREHRTLVRVHLSGLCRLRLFGDFVGRRFVFGCFTFLLKLSFGRGRVVLRELVELFVVDLGRRHRPIAKFEGWEVGLNRSSFLLDEHRVLRVPLSTFNPQASQQDLTWLQLSLFRIRNNGEALFQGRELDGVLLSVLL